MKKQHRANICKVLGRSVIFSAFYADFCLCPKSVIITTLNVRLAGYHLCGKLLFTWLSMVVSLMVSFVLSFFPRDVLNDIFGLIESVSEGFPTYTYTFLYFEQNGHVCLL